MCVRMPRPSCPHPSIPRQVPRLPDGRFPEVPLLCSCTPWQMPPHTHAFWAQLCCWEAVGGEGYRLVTFCSI